ncbi:MAG: response regulator transcription factor [Chloroflexi bacterium]|nr:response regulator transcription factor [Chloroflexota bacterium]
MPATKIIRVILIDDHARVHDAVTMALHNLDDIALIGHGSRGEEALALCEELTPDVILMDVVMPGMSGVEATKLIRKKYPNIKILVVSSFQDDDTIHTILQNGASGYVLKDAIASDLANTIRTTFDGSAVFSQEVARVLLKSDHSEPSQRFGLTQRELEILRLMAQGQNNAEIAHTLTISQSTVKFHINNVIAKIGVDTRAEAIVLAAKNNLV